MKLASLQSVALEGLGRAGDRLAQRAAEVAVPTDRVSLESSLVGSLGDALSYRANLRVLKTSAALDETLLGLTSPARAS
ncbi:MAG: hypothetical protein SFW67_32150 [Myxococcaceae bacterium]|nr:hypothetical protein [Myxococcaceae bacterium]